MPFTHSKRSNLKFGHVLGTGGFSTVYHAIWTLVTATPKEVAVKRLNAIETKELEIMSKLEHSHIVKLLGVVDEAPDFFLILELCTGGSLREYLDGFTMKRLPFTQFLDWMEQAILPIDYLREKGVVHKDIKSPNYLITGGNVLKLTDFGTAKEIDITMSNATLTASYPWMAPELLRDMKLSPNYDIFAYGVVAWELWTIKFPFKGMEPQVIAWRVCQWNQRPPIPDDCLRPLRDLIQQCWESETQKRPTPRKILDTLPLIQRAAVARPVAKSTRRRLIFSGQTKYITKLLRNAEDDGLMDPRSIAVNHDGYMHLHRGDVCVADRATAKIHVYTQQETLMLHKFVIDTTQGLEPGTQSAPKEIRVSSDGSFYITDYTRFMKVFTPSGAYRERITAMSHHHKESDNEDSCLIGLAIDGEGYLLVGEVTQNYISKHRQDGSHIASFEVDVKPWSLAVTSKGSTL